MTFTESRFTSLRDLRNPGCITYNAYSINKMNIIFMLDGKLNHPIIFKDLIVGAFLKPQAQYLFEIFM